jgi:hypothetical protein
VVQQIASELARRFEQYGGIQGDGGNTVRHSDCRAVSAMENVAQASVVPSRFP